MTIDITSGTAINANVNIDDGTVQTSKEIYSTAYKGLVTTQLFASDLKKNLLATGLGNYTLLCDVVTDSLDMLNTKLCDEIVSKHGIEAVL